MTGLAKRRLRAQRLVGEPFESPVDAVRWFGAVQSQDYIGAKWALGQRTRQTTEAGIDRLFDDGSILRTHVMRPTWHFVLPEDVRWLLGLTGSRIRLGLAGRYRELGIDEKTAARANAAFARALAGGTYLTRHDLGEVLRAARISPQGQRLPHLIMHAELDGLLVSGPRRGRDFTYALLEERVRKKPRVLDRSEALGELTRRYFFSHGPAQLQDFVWWSGLTMADARSGIAASGGMLERQAIGGREYWFGDPGATARAVGVAHLLPNFDEYTVAYRDRAALLHPNVSFEPTLFAYRSVLSNVLTIDGTVRGAWRRAPGPGAVKVEVRVLEQLRPREVSAVEEVGRHMSRFLERPVEMAWQHR